MGVFSQHSPGSAVSESEGFGREPPARVWPSLSPRAGPRPLPGAKPAPALRGSGAGGGAAGCRPGAPPGCALPAGGAGGETETGRLRKRRRCGDAGATPRRAQPGPAAATQTQTPPRGPGHCTPGLRPASHPCTRGALNPALGTPRPAGALAPAARPARTSCSRRGAVSCAGPRPSSRPSARACAPGLRAWGPHPSAAWRPPVDPRPGGASGRGAPGGPRGSAESRLARASDVRSSRNPEPSTLPGVHNLAEAAASQGVARGTRGGALPARAERVGCSRVDSSRRLAASSARALVGGLALAHALLPTTGGRRYHR